MSSVDGHQRLIAGLLLSLLQGSETLLKVSVKVSICKFPMPSESQQEQRVCVWSLESSVWCEGSEVRADGRSRVTYQGNLRATWPKPRWRAGAWRVSR